MRRMLVLPFLAVSILACGDKAPTTCTYSIAGATASSGTFPCSTLADNANGAPVVFEVDPRSAPAGWARLFIQFYLTSTTLQPGTWTPANVAYAEIRGDLPCSGPSCQVWAAVKNSGSPSVEPDQGDFTLNIESSGESVSSNSADIWYASRFTLDATMPAAPTSAATGTITLHLSNR